MTLLKNYRIKSGINENQLNQDMQNGWYPKEQFFELLIKEKHHCARNKLPISCIVFDFSKILSNDNKISQEKYFGFLRELMTFISNNSRDYDIKSLCSPNIMAILLMDANLEATKKYIKNNIKKICDAFINNGSGEYTDLIRIMKINIYPLNQIDLSRNIETTPEIRSIDFRKKDKTELSLNWKLTESDSDNSSIDTSLLWSFSNCFQMKFWNRCLKRMVDIIGSLSGLLLFSLLMITMAIAIKLTSRGPVFYKQRRAGFQGIPFTLLKFRSMYYEKNETIHMGYIKSLLNEKDNQEEQDNFKESLRSSYTPLGKVLRKTSLDELPQFVNILRGDMSLVGPRPHPFYEVASYKDWHRDRLEVKPGLTGLSKLIIRDSAKDYNDAMRMDIWYSKNWSLLLDIKIIFKTILYVINNNEAE